MSYYGRWKPYVSVAKRRAQAARKMATLRKKGVDIQPVEVDGRKIAATFWGEGWCHHLESLSDFENRLPRGRTYVRNGSVCHLAIKKGKVEAKVAGSEIYNVRVRIKTLSRQRWKKIKTQCSGKIGSLLELLEGNLSDNIMTVVTDQDTGLFPKPAEIEFDCDCPDYAYMCKHVAAVLYGIGARFDSDPSLLFRLRDVNHDELIESQVAVPAGSGKGKSKRLASDNLGDVFGIELDAAPVKKKKEKRPTKKRPTTKNTKAKQAKTKKIATRKKNTRKKTRVETASAGQVAKTSTKLEVKKKPTKTKTAKKKTAGKAESPIKRKSTTKKRSTTARSTPKKAKRKRLVS